MADYALRTRLIAERNLDIDILPADKVESIMAPRMAEAGVDSPSEYLRHLDENPDVYNDLIAELLRPPNSFSEDPELIGFVEQELISILSRKKSGDSVRIWVPQCGNGYLAYEIALLLGKHLRERQNSLSIRILATDTDADHIETARRMPNSDSEAPEGFSRHAIIHARKLIVFGQHDPAAEPSYSQMDMVVCRGYLPLLDIDIRQRTLAQLIHGLATNGVLILGRGEVIAGAGASVPTKNHPFPIFRRKVANPYQVVVDSHAVESRLDSDIANKIGFPVLEVGFSGQVVYANVAAAANFDCGRTLVDCNIGNLEPETLFAGVRDIVIRVAETNSPSSANISREWAAAAVPAPESESEPKTAIVAMVALEPLADAPEEVTASVLAAGEGLAIRSAMIAADLRAQERELDRLRKQAALLVEKFYTEALRSSRLANDLDSRNIELAIANDELKATVAAREAADIELHTAYQREHHIAEVLQNALIAPIPEKFSGYRIATEYLAAFEESYVGGDFYHFAKLQDDKYLLALGDVSGKGLEAAVYASMTKYMMLGFASESPSPALLLLRLNEALAGQSEEGWFVTLVYLLFDLKTGEIHYGNAGHEPPILLSGQTGETATLAPTGPALGVVSGAKYKTRLITLEPGDSLLLYTDGLSDAGYRDHRLGLEGISHIMSEKRLLRPVEMLSAIYNLAIETSGGKLTDDAASVLIKRRRSSA